ncbi:sugar transferase [Polynucleobacter paneuropaeus]|nr:sugar transferase [Polynucleobacter paneuropaeus]
MVKRGMDIGIAFTFLFFLLPVFVAVSLLVLLFMGSPIFFRQVRPGLNGKPFTVIKFRTMSQGFDVNGCELPDGLRLGAFGRFLRQTSLDEIPQLINVLKGDMSLVGPRPLLMEYLPLYSERQRRRHNVRPGITGWAQVNGRNALTWSERFEFDIWYVENTSLALDLRILILTILKVLRREGINASKSDSMEKFKGNL